MKTFSFNQPEVVCRKLTIMASRAQSGSLPAHSFPSLGWPWARHWAIGTLGQKKLELHPGMKLVLSAESCDLEGSSHGILGQGETCEQLPQTYPLGRPVGSA